MEEGGETRKGANLETMGQIRLKPWIRMKGLAMGLTCAKGLIQYSLSNPDFISALCKVGNLEREKVGQVVEVSSLEEICSHSVFSFHVSLSFKNVTQV